MVTKEQIKLRWLIKIRWGAVCAWGFIGFLTWITDVLRVSPLPLLLFLTATIITNLLLSVIPMGRDKVLASCGWVLLTDIALLMGLLFCYGGYTNPFSMMFLVYVTIAAFVLNAAWTWWSLCVSSVGFILLFFYHVPLAGLEVHHHHGGSSGFNLHLHGMLIAFIIIGSLTALFLTRMSKELELQSERIATLTQQRVIEEKFLAIATLAAGAAHELSTPIGTLSLISEEFAQSLGNDDRFLQDVELMREQLNRCNMILNKMRGEASRDVHEQAVRVLLSDFVSGLKLQLPVERIKFTYNEGSFVTYPRTFSEVIGSLIKNARQASSQLQEVECTFSVEQGKLTVSVKDSGTGITQSELLRVGDPFYTTKAPGEGFGLGLFMVKVFAQRVGGEVSIESIPGSGTTVTLTVPADPLLV